NTERKDFTFKGFEAIAVSHTDDPASAAAGNATAWSDPAIVSAQKQSSATFSDKEEITADNAESSPFFGNAYVCYSRFQSVASEPISICHPLDGWGHHMGKTAAANGLQPVPAGPPGLHGQD